VDECKPLPQLHRVAAHLIRGVGHHRGRGLVLGVEGLHEELGGARAVVGGAGCSAAS